MLRRIGGFLAGIIVAWIPVGGMEMATHYLYPPPPGTNMRDFAAVKAYVATLPPLALALVLFGWLLGTLLGTYAGTRIARTPVTGYLVGLVLLAGGIYNAFAIPQPFWFSAVSFVIFVGGTLIGTQWGAGAPAGAALARH